MKMQRVKKSRYLVPRPVSRRRRWRKASYWNRPVDGSRRDTIQPPFFRATNAKLIRGLKITVSWLGVTSPGTPATDGGKPRGEYSRSHETRPTKSARWTLPLLGVPAPAVKGNGLDDRKDQETDVIEPIN